MFKVGTSSRQQHSEELIYAKNCSAACVEMVSPKFQALTADTGRKHSSCALENAVYSCGHFADRDAVDRPAHPR